MVGFEGGITITTRFLSFLKIAFGESSFDANLEFVARSLGGKGGDHIATVRRYFVKDFYPDHIRRYKKRPIYWMFSSPKETFQTLIYLHRYRSDTASTVLNEYLREYIVKLESVVDNLESASISQELSPAQRTKAIKDLENTKKSIKELKEYERDVMFPLATKRIELDLDDGVKSNYPKLGVALQKIVGL